MTMRPDLPSWQAKKIEALEAWQRGLHADEKVAAKNARDAARAKSKARQHGRLGIAERIIIRTYIDGWTEDEVAAEFGWTRRNLRLRAAALGIPLPSRAGHRRAPSFWLSDETLSSLTNVAADVGSSLSETLEQLCKFLGEHEGLKARRELRAPPRSTAPKVLDKEGAA
jgi:hypothetical protein